MNLQIKSLSLPLKLSDMNPYLTPIKNNSDLPKEDTTLFFNPSFRYIPDETLGKLWKNVFEVDIRDFYLTIILNMYKYGIISHKTDQTVCSNIPLIEEYFNNLHQHRSNVSLKTHLRGLFIQLNSKRQLHQIVEIFYQPILQKTICISVDQIFVSKENLQHALSHIQSISQYSEVEYNITNTQYLWFKSENRLVYQQQGKVRSNIDKIATRRMKRELQELHFDFKILTREDKLQSLLPIK